MNFANGPRSISWDIEKGVCVVLSWIHKKRGKNHGIREAKTELIDFSSSIVEYTKKREHLPLFFFCVAVSCSYVFFS